MFKKIKEFCDYREAKKTATLLLLNSYYELIEKQKERENTEIKAYESLKQFGDSFDVEEIKNMMADLSKIANDPKLTTDFYKTISKQAHEQKMAELKVAK